ncbi:hypothetical protein CDD82_2801 [Ophiocordyceps australis]|uniref:PCI domain-containing protein n=1 Tax=Ophiocordyceps australis TaxID=1399860 RepID=A0A2C5ZGE6_9HYPO|nr:hypothetical protein CDD82_2801 [Ophiocordyceps australis]
MSASQAVHGFLQQFQPQRLILINEQPKFDLDLYLQNYSGRSRFDRLILIGTSCVPLCVEALQAAVSEAMAGRDVERYIKACQYLRSAAPDDVEGEVDQLWTQNMEIENKLETQRLEDELKGYKNNLIKETIRMGHEDLGKHYQSIGELDKAMEAFTRMHKDVSTTKHIADCCLHISKVALQQRDWQVVLTNANKMSAGQGSSEESAIQAKSNILCGVALMCLGQYVDAAQHFLQVSVQPSASEYSDLISPSDIATYGGLTALATMDRRQLQQRVLESLSFRSFLEHEVHIRKAINFFINGRYPSCLSTLESVRSDLLLDIYLQEHVQHLFSKIRSKCIQQYFIPYSNVTIQSLEAAFGRPDHDIESELATMIGQKSLKARIDTKKKLLFAESKDARQQMQAEALETAQQYEKEAKERLRRINLIAAGLQVTSDGMDQAIESVGLVAGQSWQQHDDDLYNHPINASAASVSF